MTKNDLLKAHFNVAWLRPEAALWDAIASQVIGRFPLARPSLDVGSGNGLFSFLTAGGRFSLQYDWYRNTDVRGFWKNKDIYNSFKGGPKASWIVRRPRRKIDWAFDKNPQLLRQARALSLYEKTVVGDVARQWPFPDQSFKTVFSNMFYWAPSKEHCFRETRRVLRPGGKALLCLQDPSFKKTCVSYQWKKKKSRLLQLLNRGRAASSRWTVSQDELFRLSRRHGFKVLHHTTYLKPLTLQFWDIGLRPLSPLLIEMIDSLSEKNRRRVKKKWIDSLSPLMRELHRVDQEDKRPGGYHFVCLEKKA